MRKTALRKLENLETEERVYQQRHRSSLAMAAFLCWKVVLAHNLGDLKPDDEDPGEAAARALGYETQYEYLDALFKREITGIKGRFKDACRRVFDQVGLDFDRCPRSALSHAFGRLVNELPEGRLAKSVYLGASRSLQPWNVFVAIQKPHQNRSL